MKGVLDTYFEWVATTIGPLIDLIPYDLGHSWVFWIVALFFLTDPFILIPIFVNKTLAFRYPDMLEEVGAFLPGSISARKVLRFSKAATKKPSESTIDNRLRSLTRWLWFGYSWQVAYWISCLLIISYLTSQAS